MEQMNQQLDGKFYRDVIRLLERFWTLPEMQQRMDRLAAVFWALYEAVRIRQQEDNFEASFRLAENSSPETSFDEETETSDEDLILPPEDAIYAFLEEKNWEPLQPDDDRPITRTRREKTVYECLDEQYLGKKPEEKPTGMFKFTEDGECLVIHGDKWNAIAWELDQLYHSPAAPRAMMS